MQDYFLPINIRLQCDFAFTITINDCVWPRKNAV